MNGSSTNPSDDASANAVRTDVSTDDVSIEALRRATYGQFRIDREIGRGGMGVVYSAFDQQLQRSVAIKTLPPHLALDRQVRGRFLREARTAAALSHPHIVPIYSAFEHEGVVYFVMGLVDGESLAQRIARLGRLRVSDVLPMLDQLASALGFAHERGVVHRDVKAENVLLDKQSGRAMVTDFGIARVAETQPLTATGTVLGSVHYMSPEQIAGDTLDGRSDLYSLGVLTYFALTGRFPFERATASAVVVAHVNSAPPRLRVAMPECPEALDALVARLLAKSPLDRFADAQALRQALGVPGLLTVRPPELREMGIPGTNRTALVELHEPEALSRTEAQQVWSRAAELQAHTGMVVPPPSFTPRRSAPLDTAGFDVALVKASALDAGIDAKYVDRAMQERTAADRAALAEISAGELMQRPPNWFLGSVTKLEYTVAFDGEIGVDDFEEIVDETRRALGELVEASAVGRSLTIGSMQIAGRQGPNGRAFQLQLTTRHGRTQLRAFEDLSNSAVALFLGLGIGGGFGVSALVGGLAAGVTQSPPLAVAAIGAGICGVYALCRVWYRRIVSTRDRNMQVVLRRVVARAKGILDEGRTQT